MGVDAASGQMASAMQGLQMAQDAINAQSIWTGIMTMSWENQRTVASLIPPPQAAAAQSGLGQNVNLYA